MNSYVFVAIIATLMLVGFFARRNVRYEDVRDKVVLHKFNKDKGNKHAN